MRCLQMKKKKENRFLSRCFYGFADIYGGGAFVIISTFFTVFLTKSLGMSAALAGLIPLIGRVWDAVSDPIMGNITDRTRSRFGAKRFYMLIGSVVSAITFVLMWVVLPISTQIGMFLFYTLMYILFSTGFTIVMVPYNALLPDMIEDYTLRSKFSGTRSMFSAFGAILAGLIPTLIITDNTDSALYLNVALIFGVIFFAVILLTFFGTWEKQKEPVRVSLTESFTQSLTVYKSRSFKIFIGIFLCGQGAADFVSGLAIYYVDDVLNAYGGGNFTYLMGVLLVAQFLGTIIATPIMAKTSKTFPVIAGFIIRIIATVIMFFFSYEGANFTIILILTFFIGLGMSGSSVSIYAILSDMPDVDELITATNRPGVCSSMATFVRKIATGLSSAIIGLLLTLVGYDEALASAGARQSTATQQGIAVIYIAVPIILMAATLILAYIFPLKRKEFDVIKKEIARRKGEDDSIAAPEEIAVCERITGFRYEDLWNKDNALKLRSRRR